MNRADTGSRGTPELRTAAIAVWHYQQLMGAKDSWAATLKTMEEQLRRVEQLRQELHRIVGKRDDIIFRVNGGCIEAEVEDLRFVALELTACKSQEPQTVVTLLGRCSLCGIETISEPFFTLGGLGKMLESFQPINAHSCP